MNKMTLHEGIAVPIKQANVDTDTIIPKQFLKSIKRTGFGIHLFDLWRYNDVGELGQDCHQRPLNTNFVLNQPRYQQASILVVDQNFGCGSSREHAVWALTDYGFRVLIGKSYADIFYNNCFKNGLLPVTLLASEVDTLYQWIEETPTANIRVDLSAQTVKAGKHTFSFSIDGFRKKCLLEGLDEIGLTLTKLDKIRTFEMEYYQHNPWLT